METLKQTPRSIIILIAILIVIILGLLLRFVIFDSQFEKWSDDLQRLEQWKEEYKEQNPNATDEEIDQALEENLDNLTGWRENYKKENPNATEEDIDQAWEEAWSGKE